MADDGRVGNSFIVVQSIPAIQQRKFPWSGGFSRLAVGITLHKQITRAYRWPAKASTPKSFHSNVP